VRKSLATYEQEPFSRERALTYINIRQGTAALPCDGAGETTVHVTLVWPLGRHGLLDGVALFEGLRLIDWRQRVEQSACSAGIQYSSSGTIHPPHYETVTHLNLRIDPCRKA
jgi:hypothetical protein